MKDIKTEALGEELNFKTLVSLEDAFSTPDAQKIFDQLQIQNPPQTILTLDKIRSEITYLQKKVKRVGDKISQGEAAPRTNVCSLLAGDIRERSLIIEQICEPLGLADTYAVDLRHVDDDMAIGKAHGISEYRLCSKVEPIKDPQNNLWILAVETYTNLDNNTQQFGLLTLKPGQRVDSLVFVKTTIPPYQA